MPHLDEGKLHAYLDDAIRGDVEQHLRECAECRANLERARLLKDNADAILSGTTPVGIAMPSFEELQARAKSRGADVKQSDETQAGGQHRSLSQLRTLAWAATIVLAAAVGWYARSTVLQTGQDRFESDGEATGRLALPIAETEAANSNTTEAGAEASMRAADLEQTSHDAEMEEPASGRGTPDVGAGETIAADLRETLEARRVSTTEATEPPARAREAQEVVIGAVQQTAHVEPAVAPVVTGAGGARQAPQEMREKPLVFPQLIAERSAAEPTITQTTSRPGESREFVWASVDQTTAENMLGRPVPTVAGVPVIGYATSSLNDNQAIRVLQRLESGELLELLITPENETDLSSDAKKGLEFLDAAPGVASDSVNTIDVTRGNLQIRLSAALAADSLRVLAQNIPSGR